jgi:hypothetical protein
VRYRAVGLGSGVEPVFLTLCLYKSEKMTYKAGGSCI